MSPEGRNSYESSLKFLEMQMTLSEFTTALMVDKKSYVCVRQDDWVNDIKLTIRFTKGEYLIIRELCPENRTDITKRYSYYRFVQPILRLVIQYIMDNDFDEGNFINGQVDSSTVRQA